MTTGDRTPKLCYKCGNVGAKFTCDGCRQSFCTQHKVTHREELSRRMNAIQQQHGILQRDIDGQSSSKVLLADIDRWEEDALKKIQSSAAKARADLKRLTEQSKTLSNILMSKLSNEFRKKQQDDTFTENDLDQWEKQLKELTKETKTSSTIEILEDDSSLLRPLKVKNRDKNENDERKSSSQNASTAKEQPTEADASDNLPRSNPAAANKSGLSTRTNPSPIDPSSYPSRIFGLNQSIRQEIKSLLEHLRLLEPMNKIGPMSGKCGPQTDQMEQFLFQTFGFKNLPGKYIVQGVKSFQLERYPHSMDPKTVIHFPFNTADSFAMTVQEIIRWQRSYKVYAYKGINGMDKVFLRRALQGQSGDGEEAFRMKFVVRISTCPVLMEFDAEIRSRKLKEEWPNRIKLVSVTGIDFAGRKHDVGDILYYVANWRDVFEVDRTTDQPALLNDRDFCRKKGRPKGEFEEDRLLKDLTYMAKLRLRACDEEGVQIVVETGIGLGVFAGEQIGTAEQVQITSALAIRTVLEQDGPKYKNIRAIVFALPVIDENNEGRRSRNPYTDFVEQFQETQYDGPIPVLIADQDMHRLTLAIARHGFVVSQLNPADSHGVFGEYWQNRGPAVEEKLALTTLGLLVQHHLINPCVLDPNNYYIL